MTPGPGTDGGNETLEAAEEQLNALLTLLQSADSLFTSFADQSTALVHDQEPLVQLVRDHNEDLDHGMTSAITDAFTLVHDSGSILNSFSNTSDQAVSMLDHLQALTHDVQETKAGIIHEDVANFTRLQTDTQQVLESFDGPLQACRDALVERLHEVGSLSAVYLAVLNDLRQKIDSFHATERQIVDVGEVVSSQMSPMLQTDIESVTNALQGLTDTLETVSNSFATGTEATFAHVQSAGLILHDELNTLAQHIDQASTQYSTGDSATIHSGRALQELQDLSKSIHAELVEHETDAHTAGDLSLQMLHAEQDAQWLHSAIGQMHLLLKKLEGDKAAKEHAAAAQSAHDAVDHHALLIDDHLQGHDDHLDHLHV